MYSTLSAQRTLTRSANWIQCIRLRWKTLICSQACGWRMEYFIKRTHVIKLTIEECDWKRETASNASDRKRDARSMIFSQHRLETLYGAAAALTDLLNVNEVVRHALHSKLNWIEQTQKTLQKVNIWICRFLYKYMHEKKRREWAVCVCHRHRRHLCHLSRQRQLHMPSKFERGVRTHINTNLSSVSFGLFDTLLFFLLPSSSASHISHVKWNVVWTAHSHL